MQACALCDNTNQTTENYFQMGLKHKVLSQVLPQWTSLTKRSREQELSGHQRSIVGIELV